MFFGLLIAALVLIADQVSKWYVLHNLLNGRGAIVLGDYFNIVTAWNTGVSFSMFNGLGIWGIIVLSLLAVSIVGYLLYWLHREKKRLIQSALGFIVGGALGNVIDRLRLGAVFDFLDVHVGEYHWPAFNVADTFICIGAALIIAEGFMSKHKNTEEGKMAEEIK